MDPYGCHIEAHRIPAPTQLVSLVSRDCRNSYLHLPFAIFFLGHHHVFRRSMVVTSAFGDSFPPRFSFYCDLLPCDLLSCDWTGDDGGSKGNCYPSARSCQCGAVGPHGWLIILFFFSGRSFYPSQRNVTCRHAIVSYATIPSNQQACWFLRPNQTLYFLWSMHEDYFTQPLINCEDSWKF